MTMAKYANKVVAQAQAWLGAKEGEGSHKAIIDLYNAHKPLARGYKVTYKDHWCATFVSAVAIKLGYTDIIPTECSCSKMIELLKKLGSWVEDDSRKPNPGDIIFYDWEDNGKGDNTGAPNHVGIVEKVSNGVITVIEGNHDGTDADRIDGVERREIAVNGKYIRGYGVPKYDTEPKPVEKKPDVIYQVYAGGKWLGEIKNYNTLNSNGYAGVMGKEITGLRVKLSNGKTVTVRSHLKGKARTSWLAAITKWDNTDNGYSGVKGKPIDCVAMKASGCTLKYRVHVKGGGWLDWISKYDIADYAKGLAGAYGKPIDAIQIQVI